MSTACRSLTADEYAAIPDLGRPTELVDGMVVELTPPKALHGTIYARVAFRLSQYVEPRALGRVMTNDTGFITRRDPDTVRGPDVAFYSHQRLPRGPLPESYLDAAPDIAVEVLSPGDRFSEVIGKVSEYLGAGVTLVLVLDPERRVISVHSASGPPRVYSVGQCAPLAPVWSDLELSVSDVFAE